MAEFKMAAIIIFKEVDIYIETKKFKIKIKWWKFKMAEFKMAAIKIF